MRAALRYPGRVTLMVRTRADHFNRMHPLRWIPAGSQRILDVGCNVGALLEHCAQLHPDAKLAGVDVNAAAVAEARGRLPAANIRLVSGSNLPFPDRSFDCVTCIEVLEHVPAANRNTSLQEMARVLAPGGCLVIRTPHAGIFSWLDAANLRHRFPALYGKLVRRGLRDETYPAGAEDIVWHHHFTAAELQSLMPRGLSVELIRFGGLFLYPLTDLLRWPFYRTKRLNNPVVRALSKIGEGDYGIDYGRCSFGILMILRKRESDAAWK
jgi:SAM-dependent methyltransferase